MWSLLEVLSSLPFYIEEKETNGSSAPTRTRDRVHRPPNFFSWSSSSFNISFALTKSVCVLSLSHRLKRQPQVGSNGPHFD